MCSTNSWLKEQFCQECIDKINTGGFGYCVQKSEGFIIYVLKAWEKNKATKLH